MENREFPRLPEALSKAHGDYEIGVGGSGIPAEKPTVLGRRTAAPAHALQRLDRGPPLVLLDSVFKVGKDG